MGLDTTIRIEGENAFVTVNDCDYNVCPEGDINLLIPIGVQGDSGLVTLAQFTALMNTYNAALLPFLTNEAAHTALGAGKEYVAGLGNVEAAQGTKMITYTP